MEALLQELRQAQQNFDYATEDYIDAAIYELNAAEEKLNLYMREVRGSEN